MTKKQLFDLLDLLPNDTKICVRKGDNAWSATINAFKEDGKFIVYFSATGKYHRNYPEAYGGPHMVGCQEIQLGEIEE